MSLSCSAPRYWAFCSLVIASTSIRKAPQESHPTGLSWLFFFLAVLGTRPWGLLFSSLVGSGMVQVPVWGWALIAAATAALAWASIKWGPAVERRLYRRIAGGSAEGTDRPKVEQEHGE